MRKNGRRCRSDNKRRLPPDIRDRLTGQGFEVSYLNAAQMGDLMKHDIARWQKTVKDIGLKVE